MIPAAQPRARCAFLVQQSGDALRARREYEALLCDLGDQPEYAELASDVRQRLAGL